VGNVLFSIAATAASFNNSRIVQPNGFHDLLQQAQAGDRAAMDRVLALLRPYLEHVADRYADPDRASASASDLVQEACLRAWDKLDQFRGGASDEQTLALFRSWVGQIVQHLGLNARRDGKAQRRTPARPLKRLGVPAAGESTDQAGAAEPADPEPTPSVNLSTDEQARLVQAALERLADDTGRTILRLRFFDGLSLRQIADRLAISYDKVRERYQSGLAQLERELGR
jgi:RNA polymerase sigma factor (sigma-70 family)